MFSFGANHGSASTPRSRAADIPAAGHCASDIVHVHIKYPKSSIQLEELCPPTRHSKEAPDCAQHCRTPRDPERKLRQTSHSGEMKFSHSVQFNAVPDWSSHYIAYSNLKKL